jgi:ATP-binding cassette subfamily F protein uup
VDHLLVFCGDGVVKDFIGGYTEYRTWLKDYEAAQKAAARTTAAKPVQAATTPSSVRKKLSYKEKQEFEQLEKDLEALNAEKAALSEEMNSGSLPYDRLQAASERFGAISAEIDEKELRWLELSELA